MKITAILSIVALAAPSAIATTRKRIFKVYTPEEIRRLEGTTEESRNLKGEKPEDLMSMSMPPVEDTLYCDDKKDKECYPEGGGWPLCCDSEEGWGKGSVCPEEKPPCEGTEPTMAPIIGDVVGTSYCTFTPEPECYTDGQPACCFDDAVECPEEKPECEIAQVSDETSSSPTIATIGTIAPSPSPTVMTTDPPTDPPVVIVTDPPVAAVVVTGVPTTTVETGGFTMPPDTQPPNPFAGDAVTD